MPSSMNLNTYFDSVLMLTWSDWESEPRSNRYHYASRFAKELPTFFLQHNYSLKKGISIRESKLENLEIIQVSNEMSRSDINELKILMRNRGFTKPLIWIYDSIHYKNLLRVFPNSFKVLHATEDYFSKTDGPNQSLSTLGKPTADLLNKIDLVIFVSDGVENAYRKIGGYQGPGFTIKNGCDSEFFTDILKNTQSQNNLRPSVIFQGNINNRLDYGLLHSLITSMTDWDFKFCGKVTSINSWDLLHKLSNVHYLGDLTPEEFGRHMCESSVGIIPYVQDELINNSLPLKAYEYVACGLPVVSVPIAELETNPQIFSIARTAREFEIQIRKLEKSRNDAFLKGCRHQAALENSYDSHFNNFKLKLTQNFQEKKRLSQRRKCSVAVLYDSTNSLHVSTIKEHLESFDNYSCHEITYIPASPEFWVNLKTNHINFNIFDAVILHYSVRLSIRTHLEEKLSYALQKYHGIKLLFIQDEYEGTEIARTWLDKIYFDIVYTCIPNESIEKIYPKYRFPSTQFIQVLTGYISENLYIERFATPLSKRKIDIAYRGRALPPIYGNLGHEKYKIGVDVKRISTQYDLKVDIEVEAHKRIYGDDWYKFLGSARATLGTESGSNIFDVDGSLQKSIEELIKKDPESSYEDIHKKILHNHEKQVSMNQISPKIFEAIQLKTALILFEGTYSNVISPGVHYIELKKDYSNIEDVFDKIKCDDTLERMTSCAYNDVVLSGKYSYKSFISKVDEHISDRVLNGIKKNNVYLSRYIVDEDGEIYEALPAIPLGIFSGVNPFNYSPTPHYFNSILKSPFFKPDIFIKYFALKAIKYMLNNPNKKSALYIFGKKIWGMLSSKTQIKLLQLIKGG